MPAPHTHGLQRGLGAPDAHAQYGLGCFVVPRETRSARHRDRHGHHGRRDEQDGRAHGEQQFVLALMRGHPTGIRVAHEHGLKAIAHLNGVSWTRAVELGLDELEHALPTSRDLLAPEQRAGYEAELDGTSRFMYRWFERVDLDGEPIRQLVDLLARRKIPVDLTLVVNELVYNTDELATVLPVSERRFIHPDVLAVYDMQLKASATGWAPDDFRRARAVLPKVMAFARKLHEARVPMMTGTDSGGGILFARELALHREAGIPAWDVLRMATSDAADIMRLGDRVGRIAPGYEADLVILDGDPALDMRAAGQVHAVLLNGRFLMSAELANESP